MTADCCAADSPLAVCTSNRTVPDGVDEDGDGDAPDAKAAVVTPLANTVAVATVSAIARREWPCNWIAP